MSDTSTDQPPQPEAPEKIWLFPNKHEGAEVSTTDTSGITYVRADLAAEAQKEKQ